MGSVQENVGGVGRSEPSRVRPANWAHHTLASWRENRELRAELSDTREILWQAVHMLHEQHVELERVRSRYHQLLNEPREAA